MTRPQHLPWGDPRHGTLTGYAGAGCRCMDCTQAMARYRKGVRARGLPDDDPRHGTYSTYCNYGCRCEACKAGARSYYQSRLRSA